MQEMNATKAADKFLEGLDYPISKADLVRAASEANLDDTILASFEKLFDREYRDAEDVAETLNAAP
jgi:hypothetical protein